MLILGIDPGLNTTGYGIIEENQNNLKFIEAGYIRTQPKDNIEIRLSKIYTDLANIVKRYKLDAIVLEKLYAHYKHPVTACLLGHARGIICLVCAQNNIKLFEYAATRTRKAVLGRGNASKLQTQHMVLNMLGIRDKSKIPLDITDALSLAIAHSYIAKSEKLLKLS
ncbi:MAG: crossover junction endodeoxyribonuclease RuvC [Candidatus Omnitrophica bacterium]|nr:crossover junction endodeoxyribonuclease RuvC [Candidatus Omnitrophota bacterium]MDD5352331.1 crossover junction endodeoxyribonuclease RuvC [Candidatus Omnitrophota bacterium]MDD5549929.1 crossover junction endodeoxyribonuclease RuvC [Candidatus Omnitrophota bacterium]